MEKETIDWLIYLVNYRKDVMKQDCDLTDSEVAEAVKAETVMADKVLHQLEKLQNIGDV
tara:strand:- start:329 stop:505 length:177 start_codon:yes stop_codon:yes gene_type:complete